MERSGTKRYYYYDQDYESEPRHQPRSKPRHSYYSDEGGSGGHHYASSYHRRPSSVGCGGGGTKVGEHPLTVTTVYRILCHDLKVGGVIGKCGSIIKSIRHHTGAWVGVHDLVPGDDERIIEITDKRRRDPEGRIPTFSPAQEALRLVHDKISENSVGEFGEVETGRGGGGGGGGNRVVTRLVVSKMHVGCLMGKGGKIIEQMRGETRTHIRILPRDHNLPCCVAASDEVVQVVGKLNDVKNAIQIISSRLRESQHRDRSFYGNKLNSPDHFEAIDNEFHMKSRARRSLAEEPGFRSRSSFDSQRSNYLSRSSRYVIESKTPVDDLAQSFCGEDIVFRILCPIEKMDSVVGNSKAHGLVDLLQRKIGVNVDIVEPVEGSDELVIIISSDEGMDDELFPAQEALLHIQSHIVDLVPEKENIITTRLLLQSDEIGCIGLNGAAPDNDYIGGAKVEILPREKLPLGVYGDEKIVQITGEISAARKALLEVTSRIGSHLYGEFLKNDALACCPWPADGAMESEAGLDGSASYFESQAGNEPVDSAHQNALTDKPTGKTKDVVQPSIEQANRKEEPRSDHQPCTSNRISMPIIARSTLEVVIPAYAAPLATKSRNLTLISEISGAAVKLLVEEEGTEGEVGAADKRIQISGTPEQAERAQSLLQGIILSAEEEEEED
ncbi:RNA-binding KH domain-containing protein RCF3-like [Andrographis paniculata]|uniref:RNA-binding KH domain-containing protein RCF3-like n=1 Tax=Andrographis paniculata TaxID=175694 RepID=UPI0021E99AFB|nr:RNA-binding KH domain-containing protein RCF3-like [Andrographis paniculata]